MLRSLTIQNFRGFRDLTIGPLGRVNLIAGKNNTGKSSVLEAIYLLQSQFLSSAIDELDRMRLGEAWLLRSMHEKLGWLLPSKATSKVECRIESVDGRGIESVLSLEYANWGAVLDRYDKGDQTLRFPATTNGWSHVWIARHSTDSGRETTFLFEEPVGGVIQGVFRSPRSMPSRLIGSSPGGGERMNEEFSEIELSNRQATDLIPALRESFGPSLSRLALAQVDGKNFIHADVGLGRMIPIAYVGEGMRRLLSILLAIANCKGGIVLIDEIENGFHHSVIEKVWTAIGQAARDNEVQVFATTHSYECIQAAHEAFSEAETYDLRLHRLDRVGDRIEAVTFDEETIGTAVEMFLEVR